MDGTSLATMSRSTPPPSAVTIAITTVDTGCTPIECASSTPDTVNRASPAASNRVMVRFSRFGWISLTYTSRETSTGGAR